MYEYIVFRHHNGQDSKKHHLPIVLIDVHNLWGGSSVEIVDEKRSIKNKDDESRTCSLNQEIFFQNPFENIANTLMINFVFNILYILCFTRLEFKLIITASYIQMFAIAYTFAFSSRRNVALRKCIDLPFQPKRINTYAYRYWYILFFGILFLFVFWPVLTCQEAL